MSATVKGFECRPNTMDRPGIMVGVRKSPRNETAGRLGSACQVSRSMGKALQRQSGRSDVRV